MIVRLFPHPLLTVAFWLLWMLLVNHWSAGQALLGALLAWLIPMAMRRFWEPGVYVRHPLKLIAFLVMMQRDIVMANLTVARLILGSPKHVRPAFVEVPLDIDNDFLITVLTSVVSLTPGTVSADISPDKRRLLVHTLDVREPDKLVADIKSRYEHRLKEIFAC